MKGLEFLDKAISEGVTIAFREYMGEGVASCECGEPVDRATAHVCGKLGAEFQCLGCLLVPRETMTRDEAQRAKNEMARDRLEAFAPYTFKATAGVGIQGDTPLEPKAENAVKGAVSLSRPILERPTAETTRPPATARVQGETPKRKPGRPRKVVEPTPMPPEEPTATIEVDDPPTGDVIDMKQEDEKTYAAREDTTTCPVCGRFLPSRLLAMHQANCERANQGIS